MEQISFKERVKNELIACAVIYKNVFVDYDYLICSSAFKQRDYYIISGHEDNYMHLTGVSSSLSPSDFFDKCLHGTLVEADFSFIKRGQSEREVKGSVRRKIKVLPEIANIFTDGTEVEEDFAKNRIQCSFAAADIKLTIGFSKSTTTRPMTLLKGKEIDTAKAAPISLMLRKNRAAQKFDEIIIGDRAVVEQHLESIRDMIDIELETANV